MSTKSLLIKQIKGTSQTHSKQKAILKSLGLRGIGSTIYRKDTRGIRGMLNLVQHLIETDQVEPSKTKRVPRSKSTNLGYTLS